MENTNITEATRNATLIAGEIDVNKADLLNPKTQLYKTQDGKYFEITFGGLWEPTVDYQTESQAKMTYNQACKFGKQCVSFEAAFGA